MFQVILKTKVYSCLKINGLVFLVDRVYFLFDIGTQFFIKLEWISVFKWLIMYTLAHVVGLLNRMDVVKFGV